MHDIDLIPADHRALRQGRRWWARALAGMALALLATVGARAWLQRAIAREAPQVAALRAQAGEAGALRSELLALSQREARLQDQWRDLRALRHPPPWQAALKAVDQAVDQTMGQAGTPQVWLDQLQVLSAMPAAPLAPVAAASAPVPQAYRLEVKGHAADHAALSRLVQGLGAQPGLVDVRLTQSGLHPAAGVDALDFELSAALAHEERP
jgi:Tfp pilus assembly protein PilN